MKIVEFTNELSAILHVDSISVRRSKILELISQYQQEFDIVASMSLELPKTYKFTPKQQFIEKDWEFKKDVGTFLQYYQSNNQKALRRLLAVLPYKVQVALSVIFSKSIVPKVSAEFLYDNISHYYTMKEIYSIIDLPEENLDTDGYKVKEVAAGSITKPPYYCYNVPKSTKGIGVYYITKDNGVVTSNLKVKSVVRKATAKLKYTKYSMILVVYKSGKKRMFKVLAFIDGSTKLLKVYRGKSDNLDGVEFRHTTEVDDISNLVTKNQSTIVITADGVAVLSPKVSYVVADIVDWITDDNYNPQGLVVTYNSEVYRFMISNFGDLIDSGLQDRHVVLKVQEVNGKIVGVSFSGVKRLWHTEFKHCQICKSVSNKHKTEGICKRCFGKIPHMLKYKNTCTEHVTSDYEKRWNLQYGDLKVRAYLIDQQLHLERVGQQLIEFKEYQ